MEEVCDLHQYTHFVVLNIQKSYISFHQSSTSTRTFLYDSTSNEKDTCITYDRQKQNVRSWGNKRFKSKNEDDVFIHDFIDKLLQMFKKDKDNWNQDDIFLLKAVSDFIRLSVEEQVKKSRGKIKGIDKLHFIIVVPSEWEEEIRETLIRPIFIQSNLISKNDHNDRLLFCSDIETTFYYLMNKYDFDFDLRRKTILCRLVPISESKMLIKLYLVSTTHRLFDFPSSLLYPNVEQSNSLSLTINTFTDGIRAFINDKLPLAIQEEIVQIIMCTTYYPSYVPAVRDEDYDLMKPLITDTSKWELDEHQREFMESICIFDICSQIHENMTNNIDDLILNDVVKVYTIFVRLDSFSSEINPSENLLNWSEYLLTYNRIYSRNKNIIFTDSSYCEEISSFEITKGTGFYGENVINNSDIYSRPRILSVKNPPTSSSIFRESKPDAIMNIDISIDSTILSYSFLDENGSVEEVWNHDDFLIDKSLSSLGSFFDFSETTTLNVKYSFIDFAENYLMGNASVFSNDENNDLLQLNASKIETILSKNNYTDDLLVSTQQQVYIKAFLLLYMTYLKYVVSSKLKDIVDPNMEIKIGYNITVEKILLKRLFGTKESVEDIVYASGLIQKEDNSKKMRVIAQGERILHLIRRSLALPFPLKSFFVLAQLHENYIQLTLNKVVTESNSTEEDQEAMIIHDRIIYIPNVYTSLCLNMWNNILENKNLIRLCDRHQQYSGNDSLEIFSLKNRAEFTKNLKRYISKDCLDNNSSQTTTDETIIRLSESCNCKIHLTVCDVIEISFQPVLRNIASLVSASFLNKELFGKFWNIQYIFQLIQFKYNAKFHDSFVKILKETTEDIIIERGVDISHYVLPRSLNQLFQPVLHRRPISYKEFQVGTLHHVYCDTYGFGLEQISSNVRLICKSETPNTKSILVHNQTVFLLFKRGDKINEFPTNLTFCLSPQEKPDILQLMITYAKLKKSYGLNPNGTARFDDIKERFFGSSFNDLSEEIEVGKDIPIMISISYEAYSGSLTLTAKVIGQDISLNIPQRLGIPMHFSRF